MAITARYNGSLEEYADNIGCASFEGDWTGPETTRYTVVLWDGRGTLRNVRHRSLEFGAVTVWTNSPCICRCGGEHDRLPRKEVK
jgi:hypothetical protein